MIKTSTFQIHFLFLAMITALAMLFQTVFITRVDAVCTGQAVCSQGGYEDRCVGGLNAGGRCAGDAECGFGSCNQIPITLYDNQACGNDAFLSCDAGCRPGYDKKSENCSDYTPPPPVAVTPTCGGGPACSSSETCCSDGSCAATCDDPPPPPLCTNCPAGYDCCGNGNCVPPGNPCSDGNPPCIRDGSTEVSSLWVRIFSKENGNTIFWKGNQSNDPVKTDQGWSGSGIDANGYFGTFKLNENAQLENFDKNTNRISDEMDVKLFLKSEPSAIINGIPAGWYNYTTASWQVMSSGCKAGPVTLDYNKFPVGNDEYWSHQYCGGGQPASLDSNGAPAITANQMYCLNTSLNCNADSKAEKGCTIYCDPPALDGCSGKFVASRPEGSPGETRRDNGALVSLANIINFSGGQYNGVDLNYTGAWTMSQIIYNKIEGARNFYYELLIKPPTGYTCGDAGKLYTKTYNDGTTVPLSTVVKPAIYPNGWCYYNVRTDTALILPELIKITRNTCEVMVGAENVSSTKNSIVVNVNPKGGSDNVSVSGYGISNDTRVAGAGLTRLWIGNSSWTPFSLGSASKDLVEYYGASKFSYYDPLKINPLQGYQSTPPCTSQGGLPCTPAIQATLNEKKNASDIHYTLPEGYYVAHCDVPNAPSNDTTVKDGKCTGSPNCAFNHAKLNKICNFLGIPNCSSLMESYTCAGWRECDTTPTAINEPSDIAVIKAVCVPYCNISQTTCDLPSDDDGCGGSCDASSFCIGGANENEACTADTLADDQCPGIANGCQPFTSVVGIPTLVNALAVDNTDFCFRGDTKVTWTAPSGGLGSLTYDVLVYQTGLYSTAVDAFADATAPGVAGSTAVIYSDVSALIKVIPKENLTAIGPNITIAVRATNPYCGGSTGNWNTITSELRCAQDPYITVELLKDEGGVDNNNGRCSGPAAGTTAIAKSYTSTISLNGAPYGLTTPVTSGSPTITLTNGVGRFLNLRYLPANSDGVALPFKVTLNRTPAELALDNLVQTCPTPTAGDAFQSLSAPEADNVVTAGTKGRVRFYFKQGFSPWWRTIGGLIGADGGDVTSLIPDSCATHSTCIDFLSASLTLPVSKIQSDRRAGLSIASGAITAGSGGRTQHALSQELHAAGMTPNAQSPSTDYAFFSDKIARSGAGTANILPATLLASGPTAGAATVIDGKTFYVWNLTGDQTITIDPAEWNLTDKNVVILVNGSITFDTSSPASSLITTNANSFLLVVAKDNITFSERIGRTMSGSVAVNDASPVVSGVFVAGQNLIIADGGNTTPDLQFVGKGMFAGLNGVQLLREFDDGGDGRLLNNLQPAELFIHDPQMVLNTPDFLETPIIQYQEIQ